MEWIQKAQISLATYQVMIESGKYGHAQLERAWELFIMALFPCVIQQYRRGLSLFEAKHEYERWFGRKWISKAEFVDLWAGVVETELFFRKENLRVEH